MNSKARVLAALHHEKPDRVPFNFWMDRRLMADYEKRLGHRHWRVTHFDADVIETFALLAFPTGPVVQQSGSEWTINQPCFTSWDQVDAIELPDPNDAAVYSLIRQDIAEFPDRAVFLDVEAAWGIAAAMRGTYELFYMDMLDHPAEVKTLLGRILEIQKIVVRRACELGITALYLMQDLATSRGLAMSPAMTHEFCLDYITDLIEIARAYQLPVLFHSDGCIMDLMAPLKQLGIAAVNPLQPHLNPLAEFKERHGKALAVYGGLDNCFTIPDGSYEDIRRHVCRTFDILGRPDGGLILSCHDLPIHTPARNVEMLCDTIINQCRYE